MNSMQFVTSTYEIRISKRINLKLFKTMLLRINLGLFRMELLKIISYVFNFKNVHIDYYPIEIFYILK